MRLLALRMLVLALVKNLEILRGQGVTDSSHYFLLISSYYASRQKLLCLTKVANSRNLNEDKRHTDT